MQAIVFAFALDERTVKHWLAKSGAYAQAVHEQLVKQARPFGQVQGGVIKSETQI